MKEEFRKLKIKIEEFRRTTKEKAEKINYVDFGNNLGVVLASANVVIYGRRGSGKTTLLAKAYSEANNGKKKSVYIQCELYKDHTYPNLLINILIQIFKQISENLNNLPFSRTRQLKKELNKEIKSLKNYLETPDDYIIEQGEREVIEEMKKAELSISNKLSNISSTIGDKRLKEIEKKYSFERKKINYLNNSIDKYRELISKFIELKKLESLFIMLDDYYLLNLLDQPFIVDYIFRLCKDQKAYFKITTIRHRTKLYIRTVDSQIRGIQEGADHTSIDLDFNLEQFEKTYSFLVQILTNISTSCNIDNFTNYFVSGDNGLPRLIWASGGVPRDLLILVGHLIDLSKDEEEIKFDKKLIDKAANRLFIEKLQDLNSEYAIEKEIKQFFEKIRKFCLVYNKKTVFLIKEDSLSSETLNKINNLVDHRLIHKIASNISLTKHRGPFIAYILDLGSYSPYLNIKRKEHRITEVNILRKDPYKKDTLLEVRALSIKNELTNENLKESYDFVQKEKKKIRNDKEASKEYRELVQKTIFDF